MHPFATATQIVPHHHALHGYPIQRGDRSLFGDTPETTDTKGHSTTMLVGVSIATLLVGMGAGYFLGKHKK